MMTTREVAETLKCSLANVYALIETGKLRAVCVGANGKGYRISETSLAAFLSDNTVEKAEKPPRASRPKLKHLKV
jgi:excisionase family DNA binding protein